MLNKNILQAFSMIFLTFILLLSSTTLFVKGGITIAGRIIDIEGNPIEGVRIEAYSGESLVEKIHTSANGYFSISLAAGAYELILEKEGYETRSITVSPQSVGYKNLGEIILDYSLKFSVSQLKIRVKSMSEVSIPVTLRNKGSKDELVDIEVDAPKDWEAGIYSSSTQVLRLKLIPGETQNLMLIIKIPLNASGEYSVKTRIIGSTVQEETISIMVVKEEPQVFVASYLTTQGLCGSSVTFELTIRNPLDKILTGQISVIAPDGWTVSILREDGIHLYDVSLEPGEYLRAVLKVNIPEDAQPGRYEVKVQAPSQELVSSQSFYIIVTRGVFNPRVYTGTPYVEAYAGGSASFPIDVENTGDSDGMLSINVTRLPSGYSWKLNDQAGNILSKVYLKANEKKRLNLVVNVPPLEEPKTIPFSLEAYAPESSSKLSLTLGILGFYSMSYETQNFYTQTTAGSESSFRVEVKNNGYSVLTNVRLVLTSVPEKFRVKYEPEVISILKPQERAVFVLRITTDADVSAGDYFVSFQVKSDQYSLSTVSLRVFVVQRTEMIFAGIAMVVILLSALFFIYRRYGRR
jgi:uncharacterized membrane protein